MHYAEPSVAIAFEPGRTDVGNDHCSNRRIELRIRKIEIGRADLIKFKIELVLGEGRIADAQACKEKAYGVLSHEDGFWV